MPQVPDPPPSNEPWPASDAVLLGTRVGVAPPGCRALGCFLLVPTATLTASVIAGISAFAPEPLVAAGILTDERNHALVGNRVWAVTTAVIFGGVTLFILAGLALGGRRRRLVLDAHGIWFVTTKLAAPVPWRDIRAIAGSWVEPDSRLRALANAIVGSPRRRAVEVFRHRRSDDHWALSRFTAKEQPPRDGLPHSRVRFHISRRIRDRNSYREVVERLRNEAPDLWIGEYDRGAG